MKKFIPLIVFTGLILIINFLAYNNLLPRDLKAIPYYDSIGHFVLFGIYAFLAQIAFKGKKFFHIPIGSGLIALYATLDEFIQKFSPNRSFYLWDLFFSLLGILVATYFYHYKNDNK